MRTPQLPEQGATVTVTLRREELSAIWVAAAVVDEFALPTLFPSSARQALRAGLKELMAALAAPPSDVEVLK